MNKTDIEYRTFSSDLTLREESRTIRGYAVVWDQPSQDLGNGVIERIQPGAFGDLTGKDIRAFYNHDYNYLLGRTTSNTLRLDPNDYGMAFEIDLATTPKHEEVWQLVRRGDITGVSFGAIVREDKWSADGKESQIVRMDLIEISPVVFPAFLQPKVTARSLDRLAHRPKPRFKTLDRAKAIIARDED